MSGSPRLIIRRLGLQDYEPIWNCMRYLSEKPKRERLDEIWLLSHKPVFTQGQAGSDEHILATRNIPVLQTDRGGQVTYHGPGQLVGYILLNVKRRKIGVRALVDIIERSMLETLSYYGIEAFTKPKAPGVYVKNAKIGALGLRIKNGWSYHGFSLNVDMDLAPFGYINPCGFEGLAVTQIADHVGEVEVSTREVSGVLSNSLLVELGYKEQYDLLESS
ncbi:MAG: lipoyl(octanoyl) transferase LipB [Gammaproteobacteria bacterium]|nr:lipoyl(octanoyl) transferase LipB [Gammaproteobacteria bacterium]